jgi:cell division protein FtsI (penicillin-binding protein 3)
MSRRPPQDEASPSIASPMNANWSLPQAKFRLMLVLAAFLLGYFAISLRLIDLTLLRGGDGDAKRPAASAAGPQSLRGQILDRNGELMATSLKMASVYADATLITDAPAVARDLARILGENSPAALEKKLSSGRKFVWLSRNITPRQEYEINSLGHPGVGFEHEYRRIYPHGRLTAHLLGYTDVDGRGIAGVERGFDRELNFAQEDVRLTVDLRIQHILHRELEKAKETFQAIAAVGMVMDVQTGEIIAAVSLPDYDPHHPGDASDDARFNRVSLGVYEMGSTFKLFPTAAALDEDKVSFATRFDASKPIKIGRFSISDWHGKKRVLTVPEVFIHSSNIGTAKMALALGANGLREFYERLGFFKPVPMDFPERGQPLYPQPWREVSTITASFGHGVAVTPVHLMRAASALVNGGILIKPQIALSGDTPRHRLQGERVVRPETTEEIRKLMQLTVASGSGSKAYVEGYDVGGKTGTADKIGAKGYNRNARLSSFLGVFPMSAPRYAVLAIIDEPKPTKETYGYATGGWTAAPVVARVIEQMGPLYQIPPDLSNSHDIRVEMAPYLMDEKLAKKGTADATQ